MIKASSNEPAHIVPVDDCECSPSGLAKSFIQANNTEIALKKPDKRDRCEVFLQKLILCFEMQKETFRVPFPEEIKLLMEIFNMHEVDALNINPLLFASSYNMHMHICESENQDDFMKERKLRLEKIDWKTLFEVTGYINNETPEVVRVLGHFSQGLAHQFFFSSLTNIIHSNENVPACVSDLLPLIYFGAHQIYSFFRTNEPPLEWIKKSLKGLMGFGVLTYLSETESVQSAVHDIISTFPNELSETFVTIKDYAGEANPFLILLCSALYLPVINSYNLAFPTTSIGRGIVESLPFIKMLNQLCSRSLLNRTEDQFTAWLGPSGEHLTGIECRHMKSNATTVCKNLTIGEQRTNKTLPLSFHESSETMTTRINSIDALQHSLYLSQTPRSDTHSFSYQGKPSQTAEKLFESTLSGGVAEAGTYAEFLPDSRVRIYRWNAEGVMTFSDYKANESQSEQLKILLGGWKGGLLKTVNEESREASQLTGFYQAEPPPLSSYSQNRHPEATLALGGFCALALAGAGAGALLLMGAYAVMFYFKKEALCIPLNACSGKNSLNGGSPGSPLASIWPSISQKISAATAQPDNNNQFPQSSQLSTIPNRQEKIYAHSNSKKKDFSNKVDNYKKVKSIPVAASVLKQMQPDAKQINRQETILNISGKSNHHLYPYPLYRKAKTQHGKTFHETEKVRESKIPAEQKDEKKELIMSPSLSASDIQDDEIMFGDDPGRSSLLSNTNPENHLNTLLLNHFFQSLKELNDIYGASFIGHSVIPENTSSTFNHLDESTSIQPQLSTEGKRAVDVGSFFNNNDTLPIGSTYTLVAESNGLTYSMNVVIPETHLQANTWQHYVLDKLTEMSEKIDEEFEGEGFLLFTKMTTEEKEQENIANKYGLYVSERSPLKSVNKYLRISPILPSAISAGIQSFKAGDHVIVPDCSGMLGHMNKLLKKKKAGYIQPEFYCDVRGQFYTQWGPLSLNNNLSPFIQDWTKKATIDELESLMGFWKRLCEKIHSSTNTLSASETASIFLHLLTEYADDLRQDVISNPKKFLNKYFRTLGAPQDIMDLKVAINILRSYELPVQSIVTYVHTYNLAGVKVRKHTLREKINISIFELITRPEIVESFKNPSRIFVTNPETQENQVVEATNSLECIEFPEVIPDPIKKNIQDVWQQTVYREKALEIVTKSSTDVKFKTGVIQELNLSVLRRLQAVAQGNFSVHIPPSKKTPDMCPPLTPPSFDNSNRIIYLKQKAETALVNGKGLSLLRQGDICMSRAFLIPDIEPNKYALIRLDSPVVTIIHIDPEDKGVDDAVISEIQSGFPPQSISGGKCVASAGSMVSLVTLVQLERHKFDVVSADEILLESMWNNFLKMSERLTKYTFHDKYELNSEILAQDFRDYVIPALTGLTVLLPFGQLALFPELMALEGAAGVVFKMAEEGVQITIDTANYGLIAGLTGELLLESLADADRPLLAARDHQALLNSLVVDFILMSPAFMPRTSAKERISAAFSEAERLGTPLRSASDVSLSAGLNKVFTARGKNVQTFGDKLIRINDVNALKYLPQGTPVFMTGMDGTLVSDAMIIDSDSQLWCMKNPAETMSSVKLEKVSAGNDARLTNTVLCPTFDNNKVRVFIVDNEINRDAILDSDFFYLLPQKEDISDLVALEDQGEHCVLADPTEIRKKRVPLRCIAGKKISADDLLSVMLKLDITLGIGSSGASVDSWHHIFELTRDVGLLPQEELMRKMINLYLDQEKTIKAQFTQILNEINRNSPEGLAFLMSTLAGNRFALNSLTGRKVLSELAESDIFGTEFTEITDVSNLYDMPEGSICVFESDGKHFFMISKGRNAFYGINAGKELPTIIKGLGKIDDDTVSWTAVGNDNSGVKMWVHSKFGEFYGRRLKGLKLTPEETLQALVKPDTVHPGLSAAQTMLYNERINSYVGPVVAERVRAERENLVDLNQKLNSFAGKKIPEELQTRSSEFESALNAFPHYRESVCYMVPDYSGAGSLKKGDVLIEHAFNEFVSEISLLHIPVSFLDEEVVVYHIKTSDGIIVPDHPGDNSYSKGTIIIPPGECFEVIDVLTDSQLENINKNARKIKVIVLKSSNQRNAVNRRNIFTGKFDDEHFRPAPELFSEGEIPVLKGKELSGYFDALAFGQYHATAMGQYHVKGVSIFKSEFPGYADDIKKELAAVNQLPSFMPEKVKCTYLFRGNDIAKETLEKIIRGDIGYIQNHRILFTSTSEIVARNFIKASEAEGTVPVLFRIRYNPENEIENKLVKLGRKNPNSYSGLFKNPHKELVGEDIEEIKNSNEVLFGRGVLFRIIGQKSINKYPAFGGSINDNHPGIMVSLEIVGAFDDVYDVTFNGELTA